MPQYDVDLRDYWRILRKRKLIVILMVVLVGVSSYGFAKLREPIPLYETSASVKIEQSTSMLPGMFMPIWGTGENIVTQAFIIRSFPVLEQAAKLLGWLPTVLTEEEIQSNRSYLSVILRLKSITRTEQEPGTNVINIIVTSQNREETALVANAVANAFRRYNIQERNRQTFETKAFIEKQLSLTEQRLNESEEALRSYKQSYSMPALGAHTSKVLVQLSSAEDEVEKIDRLKEEAQTRLALLEGAKDSFEKLEGIFFPFESSDSPVRSMSSRLNDLVLRRQTLLNDFTGKHPDIKDLNETIKSLIAELKRELEAYLRSLDRRAASNNDKLEKLKAENNDIPEKALQLDRLQREVSLQERLYSHLKTKYQEVRIQESGKIEEVTIIRPALVPSSPINLPSKFMIVATGVVMGLIIGLVFSFVAETLDTSIGTIEDVESLLGVPVQGLIPFLDIDQPGETDKEKDSEERRRSRYLVTHFEPKSLAAEAFRSLRTNIQFLSREKQAKVLLITSSFVQEGKTFNVINAALSMAQAGERVLLIDADLRKPGIHRTFGLNREPGLTDYVLGNYVWKEVVNTITDVMLGDFDIDDILRTQGLDKLHIITAGVSPPNPSEILRSAKLQELIKEAYDQYGFIFIDAPPVLPVSDATEIAPFADGVILVYKVGQIGRGVLKRAKNTLDNVNAKVLGVILNNVKPEVGPDYFKYQTQYYYAPEEEKTTKLSFFRRTFEKLKELTPSGRLVKIIAIILSLLLLAIGLFWKEIFAVAKIIIYQ